jgi:hypothetical protein
MRRGAGMLPLRLIVVEQTIVAPRRRTDAPVAVARMERKRHPGPSPAA